MSYNEGYREQILLHLMWVLSYHHRIHRMYVHIPYDMYVYIYIHTVSHWHVTHRWYGWTCTHSIIHTDTTLYRPHTQSIVACQTLIYFYLHPVIRITAIMVVVIDATFAHFYIIAVITVTGRWWRWRGAGLSVVVLVLFQRMVIFIVIIIAM